VVGVPEERLEDGAPLRGQWPIVLTARRLKFCQFLIEMARMVFHCKW
jgi:hypothetical protein